MWPSDQRMATSSALSKILPCPSAAALCWAALNTFSNTRGTATSSVGRASASSSGKWAKSVANASLVPHSTHTRAMILVSVWASGRNSKVTSSSPSIDRMASRFWATFVRRLLWVCMQPLGRPVVPDV